MTDWVYVASGPPVLGYGWSLVKRLKGAPLSDREWIVSKEEAALMEQERTKHRET